MSFLTSSAAPLMAFNFFSSVGIINVNKYLFQELHFEHSILLTAIHFFATFLGLCVCLYLKMFTHKPVPLEDALYMSAAFVGFVVFNNLSLQLNSMGFYQLFKVMTTPVILLIQYNKFQVPIHPTLRNCLVPLCVGVLMATVSDVQMNMYGTLAAVCGVLSTSIYQIFVKSKQQDLGLNSFQLLFYQAPISAFLVFVLAMVMDPPWGPTGWMSYEYSQPALNTIGMSCALAFCVNLSIFLVIGKTSPISYNVLGHFKLVCVLLSGLFFFGEDTNPTKLMGTLLALIGVIVYTHYKQNIQDGWAKRAQQMSKAASSTIPPPLSPKV